MVELYESIKAQTYKNWEWIIYLNGAVVHSKDYDKWTKDKRIKIYRHETGLDITADSMQYKLRIGEVKRLAFSLGVGDVLVEADHDDILDKDCLKELNKAFQNEKYGFVYSNNALLGAEKPFSAEHGWTFTKYPYKDRELFAMDAFEPTGRTVSSMWFSPQHVRAWRRGVYEKLGGHNPEYIVCDDLELLIRTYLSVPMYHLPKTLYIYRLTGNNSFLRFGDQINAITNFLIGKYINELQARDKVLGV